MTIVFFCQEGGFCLLFGSAKSKGEGIGAIEGYRNAAWYRAIAAAWRTLKDSLCPAIGISIA